MENQKNDTVEKEVLASCKKRFLETAKSISWSDAGCAFKMMFSF